MRWNNQVPWHQRMEIPKLVSTAPALLKATWIGAFGSTCQKRRRRARRVWSCAIAMRLTPGAWRSPLALGHSELGRCCARGT